jgi:hypothetical protein
MYTYISLDMIWHQYVYYTYKERQDFNAKKIDYNYS